MIQSYLCQSYVVICSAGLMCDAIDCWSIRLIISIIPFEAHGVDKDFFLYFLGCANRAPASWWHIRASCSLEPPQYFCSQAHGLLTAFLNCLQLSLVASQSRFLNLLVCLECWDMPLSWQQHQAQYGLSLALVIWLHLISGLLRVLESPWIIFQIFKAWKVLEDRHVLESSWICVWKSLKVLELDFDKWARTL